MHGGPPNQLAISNSEVVYVSGIVDVEDAVDANGNPKWVDAATVAWEIRTAEGGGGTLAGSGAGVPKGSGKFACLISATVMAALFIDGDYIFRTLITLPGNSVPDADIDTPFKAVRRTGETPYT